MARHSSRTARRGFTLLEMILAASIAVLLLGALYSAMDLQLRHAEAARDVVGQSILARTILQRISGDVAPSLGMPDVIRYQTPGSGGAAGGGGTTAPTAGTNSQAGTGTAPTTSGTGASATGSGAAAATTSGPSPTIASGTVTSGTTLVSLQGDAGTLTVFVSRVPSPPANSDNPDVPSGVSDLHRISYYLAGSPDAPLGLVRYESAAVTSDDATLPPPEVNDPASPLIAAAEVKELAFSYFDGTSWVESWDSSTPGSDGATPTGPPAAIAIRITIAAPGAVGGSEVKVRTYRHVIAVPTANGPAQQSSTTSEGMTP